MCPDDTTPDPRDMMRAPDEPQFLQPRPRAAGQPADLAAGPAGPTAADTAAPDRARPGPSRAAAQAMDPTLRPPLPDHSERMAVDIEDEEADPVGSDQPDLRERVQGDSELRRG